jgi:hypothetical protein
MFKIIDPQHISKRSFTTNKNFTVNNTTSGSFGNFVARAISSSAHNYVSASDTITHIISGSVTSSYYSLPTYHVIGKLYYNDIHNRFQTKKNIKTEWFDNANVFSIPRNLIGERIKPGSLKLSDTSRGQTWDIRDDTDGNLYDFGNHSGSYAAYKSSSYDRAQGIDANGSGSQIGNVFYEHGIFVITDTGSYGDVGFGTSYTLDFQATQKHYEYEYICTAGQYEFNNSMNISVTKNRSGSISITSGPEPVFTTVDGTPILDEDDRVKPRFGSSPYMMLPPGSGPKGELITNGDFTQVIAGNGTTALGAWVTDGTATLNTGSTGGLHLTASAGAYPSSQARVSQEVSTKIGKEYLLTGRFQPVILANGAQGNVVVEESGYFAGTDVGMSGGIQTESDFKVAFTATKETHHIILTMEKNALNDGVIWENISLKEWHGFNSGIGDYKSEYKATEYFESFVTHSEFRPYVTQVGLYDEQDRLLAHAKLSKPIKLDNQYDTSFVVRFDV